MIIEESQSISFDKVMFCNDAILRACYDYSDRVYFELNCNENDISVEVKPKVDSVDLHLICNEIKNSAIDHKLRLRLEEQTRSIKEVLIRAALKEAGVE